MGKGKDGVNLGFMTVAKTDVPILAAIVANAIGAILQTVALRAACSALTLNADEDGGNDSVSQLCVGFFSYTFLAVAYVGLALGLIVFLCAQCRQRYCMICCIAPMHIMVGGLLAFGMVVINAANTVVGAASPICDVADDPDLQERCDKIQTNVSLFYVGAVINFIAQVVYLVMIYVRVCAMCGDSAEKDNINAAKSSGIDYVL